jgi:hypothetical protein
MTRKLSLLLDVISAALLVLVAAVLVALHLSPLIVVAGVVLAWLVRALVRARLWPKK